MSRNSAGMADWNGQRYEYTVCKITKHRFEVESHSDPTKSYLVQRVPQSDIWYCNCAYFYNGLTRRKDRHCYHIKACIDSREKEFTARSMERLKVEYFCPKCHSTTFVKNGTRRIAGGLVRQLYRCKECNHRFSLLPKGFTGSKSAPEVITDAIYSYERKFVSAFLDDL